MDIKHHYDNLVIGFGKGGKTLAAWLTKRGEEVAIVETTEIKKAMSNRWKHSLF